MKGAAEEFLGFRHPRTRIIPNAVDTDLFRYAGPPEDERGLSVRSLSAPKYGVDIGIQAFGLLGRATLTVIGTGILQKEYEAMAARTGGRVRIEARSYPHPQMPHVYDQYDFFVAPSRTEAQGVAMCEAMACGLPVVASRVGGIPEFVRDGTDGLLYAPNTPEVLAQTVYSLLSDPLRMRRMSRSAREMMRKKCAPEVTITMEIELLEEASATRP
jgi:glycosyltransferase involved in cell wall biosynthesis